MGILSCFLEHETRNADVDIWGETRYGHPPLQSGFFFFDKWKFSLKLEEMLHNGRSKGRVQAVDLLTEHLTMDITKGRGGNSSFEQAVGGYGYALKCMRCNACGKVP